MGRVKGEMPAPMQLYHKKQKFKKQERKVLYQGAGLPLPP